MRSVCFSMVKNEEDIIEAFVRHTLGQVDHLYVADNLSTDGTSDILHSLIGEGLPLTVMVDAEQAMLQNVKMTAMYRKYSEVDEFDFAFFLDADEFLEFDKDVAHPIRKSIGAGHAFYVPRINYLYTREPTPGVPLSVFDAMTTLDTAKLAPKSMILHESLLCKRYHIGNGNHHVRDWGKGGETVSKEQPLQFARILHFPIRSIDQYLRKSLLGWLALQLREPGVNHVNQTIGSHWRTQYSKILEQGANITEMRVVENLYGAKYADRKGVERPFHPDFPILYSDLIRNEPVMVHLVRMYSRTIDDLWEERGEWEKRVSSLQAQKSENE